MRLGPAFLFFFPVLVGLVFYGLAIAWAVVVLQRLREHSTLLSEIATELRARRQPAQPTAADGA